MLKGSWLIAPFLLLGLLTQDAPSRRPPAAPALPLALVIREMEEAGSRGDLAEARRKADRAFGLARSRHRWQDLVDTGDAIRRASRVLPETPELEAFEDRARRAYRTALGNARREQSLDGVLRVAEGLAELGVAEEVEESLRLADRLAAFDPEAEADVRAAAVRLGELLEGRLPRPAGEDGAPGKPEERRDAAPDEG